MVAENLRFYNTTNSLWYIHLYHKLRFLHQNVQVNSNWTVSVPTNGTRVNFFVDFATGVIEEKMFSAVTSDQPKSFWQNYTEAGTYNVTLWVLRWYIYIEWNRYSNWPNVNGFKN